MISLHQTKASAQLWWWLCACPLDALLDSKGSAEVLIRCMIRLLHLLAEFFGRHKGHSTERQSSPRMFSNVTYQNIQAESFIWPCFVWWFFSGEVKAWPTRKASLKNVQYLCLQHCSIIFSWCNYSSNMHFSSHFGSFFASRMPESRGTGAFSGGASGGMWFNQTSFFPAEFLLANRKTPALTGFSHQILEKN